MNTLLLKNTLYSGMDKVVVILIGFIFVSTILSIIGPIKYGVFLILSMLSVTNALNMFDLGLGVSVQYFIAYYKKNTFRKNTIVVYSVLLYTFIGFLVSFFIYLLSNKIALSIVNNEISYHESLYMTHIIAINIFFQFLTLAFKAVLEGESFFYLTNLLNTLSYILQALLIVSILSFTSNLSNAFEIILFITILKLFFLVYWTRKYILKKFNLYIRFNTRNSLILKKILLYSLDIFVNRIVGFINTQTDKILIWKYLNPLYMTIYDIVTKPIMPLRLIVQVLNSALLPEIINYNKANNYQKIFSLYSNFMTYAYILILPISFFLMFYIDLILKLWVGETYTEYSDLSVIVILTYMIFPIIAVSSSIVTGLKLVSKMHKYIVMSAMLNFLLSLILIGNMGIFGLLVATLISSLILIVPYNNILKKYLKIKINIYQKIGKIFLMHIPILFIYLFNKIYLYEFFSKFSLSISLIGLLIQYFINYKFLLKREEKTFFIKIITKRKQ